MMRNFNLGGGLCGLSGPGGFVAMIIIWLLLGIGVLFLFKRFYLKKNIVGVSYSALDIIKLRYAKGEINQQEYEEKLNDLK